MKRIAACLAVVAALLLPAAGAAMADEETPAPTEATSEPGTDPAELTDQQKVHARVQPSIVFVLIEWKAWVYDTFNKAWFNDGEPFELSFQCTGYVVNPDGYIATAGHCVDPKAVQEQFILAAAQWAVDTDYYTDNPTVEEAAAYPQYRVEGSEPKSRPDRTVTAAWSVSAGGVETSDATAAKVIKFQSSDQGDGAVLKIQGTDMPALSLADSSEIEVGTEVVAIGYPASVDLVTDMSFEPSYKEGSVSSVKTVGGGIDTVYEVSAAMSGGMSGGPTVDLDGQVIGFNSYTIVGEEQQFNFIRPSSTILAILADIGVENELGTVSSAYNAGLDAYFAGDKEAAVESFQTVVDIEPSHELAQQFLADAKALPDPEAAESGDDGGIMTTTNLVIAGAVLLALLFLVGVLVATRRRRSGPQAPTPVAGGWTAPMPGQPQPPAQPMQPAGAAWPQQPGTTTSIPASTPSAAGMGGPPVGAGTQPTPPVMPPEATAQQPATGQDVLTSPGVPPQSAAPTPPVGFTPPPEEVTNAAQAEPAVYCTNCGAQARPGVAFCGRCGTKLA